MAIKRIQRELDDIISNNPPEKILENFALGPPGDDLYHWEGCFVAPNDSLYAGGIFMFDIHFPTNYPFKPPNFTFSTKIYHPDIDPTHGVVCGCDCPDAFLGAWNPSKSIKGAVIVFVIFKLFISQLFYLFFLDLNNSFFLIF